MNGPITSPEQLNDQMKVSPLRVWVILVLLTTLVGGGLTWFLSQKINVEERYPIYATDYVAPVARTFYGMLIDSFDGDVYFDMDYITELYGERVEGVAQVCYLIVPDLSRSEVVDGMKAYFAGTDGTVVLLPSKQNSYDDILELGITDEDMREAGLNPGVPCYACPVFVRSLDGDPAVEPGSYIASVNLDTLDPVSFILKQ